ncbi:MAG: hypothetical protein KC561_20700, partial [Myxococcales bacterium]|nr:hypothetical protein [Myxococcales bacterium]
MLESSDAHSEDDATAGLDVTTSNDGSQTSDTLGGSDSQSSGQNDGGNDGWNGGGSDAAGADSSGSHSDDARSQDLGWEADAVSGLLDAGFEGDAASCQDDGLNNNDIDEMASAVDRTGMVICPGVPDVYFIPVPAGQRLEVRLLNASQNGDVDVRVYDNNGYVTGSTGREDTERAFVSAWEYEIEWQIAVVQAWDPRAEAYVGYGTYDIEFELVDICYTDDDCEVGSCVVDLEAYPGGVCGTPPTPPSCASSDGDDRASTATQLGSLSETGETLSTVESICEGDVDHFLITTTTAGALELRVDNCSGGDDPRDGCDDASGMPAEIDFQVSPLGEKPMAWYDSTVIFTRD